MQKPEAISQKYLTIEMATYTPTQELSKLSEIIGERETSVIMANMLAKVLMSSDHDVPNPDTYIWLCTQIIYQYPTLEIGEWGIALKNGVTGAYGPIYYGKIQLDTIGSWVKKYKEETWPQIAQKIQAAKVMQQQKQLMQPKKDIVPMPDWFKEKIESLDRRLKAKIIKKPGAKTYYSLRDYCTQNEIDFNQFIKPHAEKWESDYRNMLGEVKPTERDLKINYIKQYETLLAEINAMWEE